MFYSQGPSIYGKTGEGRAWRKVGSEPDGKQESNNSKQTPAIAPQPFALRKVSLSLIVLLMGVMNCLSNSEMFLVGTHTENWSSSMTSKPQGNRWMKHPVSVLLPSKLPWSPLGLLSCTVRGNGRWGTCFRRNYPVCSQISQEYKRASWDFCTYLFPETLSSYKITYF